MPIISTCIYIYYKINKKKTSSNISTEEFNKTYSPFFFSFFCTKQQSTTHSTLSVGLTLTVYELL